ncbi:MAG: hypothetical protein M2R45_04573 [Verrucomicrobia subdivision 3 bacterium]|nr:hypothetical protein [Limisphaerales bacterium]MCS1417348.1 hypothetical protein [Limisphaerales bacterium]
MGQQPLGKSNFAETILENPKLGNAGAMPTSQEFQGGEGTPPSSITALEFHFITRTDAGIPFSRPAPNHRFPKTELRPITSFPQSLPLCFATGSGRFTL